MKLNLGKYLDNLAGIQVFQLIRYGTLLLISIVLAKSGFPTAIIGAYEVFIFIANLLCSSWINGLIQSLLVLYRNNQSFGNLASSKSPELFNSFLLVSFFSVLAILTLLLFRNFISNTFAGSSEIPYFNYLLVYIFFSCPAYFVEYIYLLQNKAAWILRYGILSFSAQLALVAIPAILGGSMEACISGFVIVSAFRYIWLLVLLKKYSLAKFSSRFAREHLSHGYPLIISTLLGSSAQYVDSLLILNKFDKAAYAVFSYGAKEFPLVLLLANSLSTALIPEFSAKEKLADSLKLLKRKSAGLMHLLFPVTIIFLVSSHWLYPVIFNKNFSDSADIFNIYLLLIISRLVFPHPLIIGLKKTRVVMYASLAELFINVSLSILFINLWGIEGVAYATLIAYSVQKVIWVAYNGRHFKVAPKEYIPVNIYLLYSVITLAVFYFVQF